MLNNPVGYDTTIWCIYIELDRSPNRQSFIPDIAAIEPRGRNVIIGDFNMYYLL